MNYISILILQGITTWKFVECALTWEIDHHTENKNGNTWEEADAICKASGKMLAVVDSEEKWEKVKYVITDGNRYTAEADVYIGLTFTPSINNFTWTTGVKASWAKWFENEPYYTDTRHCVRLDVYAQYYFRTTDCSYKHHFVCSYEVHIPDESVIEPVTSPISQHVTSASGIKDEMIVGLSIGFGIFLGIGILICFMCHCCCHFPDKKYAKEPTSKKLKPFKAQALSQYEIFMNQTEGIDYNRAKSCASASASPSYDQPLDDVFYDDYSASRVIDVEPNNPMGNKIDDVSLNDSSSPSTIR